MSANQFTSTYANLVHRIEKKETGKFNKTYQNCVSCILNNYLECIVKKKKKTYLEWISNTNYIIKPIDRILKWKFTIKHNIQNNPKGNGDF